MMQVMVSRNRMMVIHLPDPKQCAAPVIDPDKYTSWENGEPILNEEYDALYGERN